MTTSATETESGLPINEASRPSISVPRTAVSIRGNNIINESKPSRRIDDIEALRAIAVLFVIVYHTHDVLLTWPDRNLDWLARHFDLSTGVNIFFGISGFVIARSLLPILLSASSIGAYANATGAFWIRRAWRLLPSAWLWLFLIQVGAVAFNASGSFAPAQANFAAWEAGLLNVANFRFALTFLNAPYGGSFHYWSLSLEEQFYILLPVAAFIFRRQLVPFLISLILLQWALQEFVYPVLMNAIRSDGLLCGVLIAIWAGTRNESPALSRPKSRTVIAVLAWTLPPLIAAARAEGNVGALVYEPEPVTILCSILVFIASFDRNYLLPAGIIKRSLMWIGSRSYALYLIHIPAFCLTREIWLRMEPPGTAFNGRFTIRFLVTALVILLSFGELNYRIVEVPLRRRGIEIARRLCLPRADGRLLEADSVVPPLARAAGLWVLCLLVADLGRRGFPEFFRLIYG